MLRRSTIASRFPLATLLCGLALLVGAPGAGAVGQVPDVDAASYILVNPATGETLAASSSERPLAMASTTKIMTAVVALSRPTWTTA